MIGDHWSQVFLYFLNHLRLKIICGKLKNSVQKRAKVKLAKVILKLALSEWERSYPPRRELNEQLNTKTGVAALGEFNWQTRS